MRPATRTAVLLTALALLPTTTACTSTETAPKQQPPTASVLVSEEQAETEAEAAYARYIDVSNTVMQGGALDLDPLRAVTTPERFAAEAEESKYLSQNLRHSVGGLKYDSFSLREMEPTGEVSAYVCLDATEARVIDAFGEDVTPEREERLPLAVKFTMTDGEMLLAESYVWPGSNFC